MNGNKEAMAKELKQLRNKIGWLNHCIGTKLGTKLRKSELMVPLRRMAELTCFRRRKEAI